MTGSILARDGQGRLGIAIASRFFAVGALCLHSRGGVGARSTQALLSPLYGPAGGDKRGKQAAALRIQGDQDYAELDLRVDDHDEPVTELQRLYRKSLERFQPFIACLPGRPLGCRGPDRPQPD